MTDRLPKTPRGRNRAVELLRCAIDVFIEYGYEGASSPRIIERSGGSRTVIYQVYGNKEGLFLAALGMMADDVYQAYVSDYHPGRDLRESSGLRPHLPHGHVHRTRRRRLPPRLRTVLRPPRHRRVLLPRGREEELPVLCPSPAEPRRRPDRGAREAAARFIEMLRGPLLMRILCTPETQVTPEEIEEAAVPRRHHDRLDERALARDQSRLTRTAPIMGAASKRGRGAFFRVRPPFPKCLETFPATPHDSRKLPKNYAILRRNRAQNTTSASPRPTPPTPRRCLKKASRRHFWGKYPVQSDTKNTEKSDRFSA